MFRKLVGMMAALAVGVAVSAANAGFTGYNIDVGDGQGAPSDDFGAAAGQSGFWNLLADVPGMTPVTILDIFGIDNGVTIMNDGGAGDFTFDNPGTMGDVGALLDDYQDVGSVPATAIWTISGLDPGLYVVYTYAWAPDDATFLSTVDVAQSDDGPQVVGGEFNGFELGVTHALHAATVGGEGVIEVTIDATSGFGTLNGFQIVQIPGPGALAIVGLGLVAGRRRRR